MRVRSFFRRRTVQIGGAVLACVALVSLILWVLPRPHRPLEYMIAGTAGTIVWLALVLAIVNQIRWTDCGVQKKIGRLSRQKMGRVDEAQKNRLGLIGF